MEIAASRLRVMHGYQDLAIFNAHGHLVAHTDTFYVKLPVNASELLRDAVVELHRRKKNQQWFLINGHRALIQALAGPSVRYAVTLRRKVSSGYEAREILSPRQLEIAEYAAAGATASEIARQLDISVHTVRQHIKEVYRRLNVANRIELSKTLDGHQAKPPPKRPPAHFT